ncbi:hypothetical protein PGIN_11A_00029 [Porphyromonas gingivalis]|nr:hypothetical protein PGIN_11A_00029 [Porphyromonas gingivalis]
MDTGCIPPTVNFFQYTSYISAYAEISPPSWCDKNADAELLGSGGEVFFEDTKALSELLRCFDIFSWFVAPPTVNFFSTQHNSLLA